MTYLNHEETEATVAEYVAVAMQAACDDETPEEAEVWVRRMLAAGYATAVWRRIASLYLA